METVIVISLLIIIALLVEDKIVIKRRSEQKPMQKKVNPNLPDIMGSPKPVEAFQCQTLPMKAKIKIWNRKRIILILKSTTKILTYKFQRKNWTKFSVICLILRKRKKNGTGMEYPMVITVLLKGKFEELSSVGMLLQKEKWKPSQRKQPLHS